MPKQLQKSLQDYISKIKKPTKQLHLPSKKLSSSTSWILRGCKHPKTPSFSIDQAQENEPNNKTIRAATLSDVDRFLFENFRSLYQKEYDGDDDVKGKKIEQDNNVLTPLSGCTFASESIGIAHNEEKSSVFLFESPKFFDLPVDFQGSHRFFIDRCSSGSLIEEARISITTSEYMASSSTTVNKKLDESRRFYSCEHDDKRDETKDLKSPDDFITLLSYSPDPYNDFKQSMHEMIEARLHFNGKIDWEFMEELLFCYLNLNDKKLYKFILGAFVDLIVVLRENSGSVPVKSRHVSCKGERRRIEKREI